jgi:hypothetical protein
MKRWASRAVFGLYVLLLLAATVRAGWKFGGEAAGETLGLGLVFGIVIWRAWRYILVIVFGGGSQFSRR